MVNTTLEKEFILGDILNLEELLERNVPGLDRGWTENKIKELKEEYNNM